MVFLMLTPYKENEIFYIMSDGIPTSIRDRFPGHLYMKMKKGSSFSYLVFILLNYLKLQLLYWKNNFSGVSVYSQDYLFAAPFFLYKSKKNPFYLIEDGIGNWTMPPMSPNLHKSLKPKTLSDLLRKKLLHPFPEWGRSDRVKNIYLTSGKNLPVSIASKVIVLNIKELWDKKIEDEKKYILSKYDLLDSLSELKGRKILLLTQPLDIDAGITIEEKMGIYQKMICRYDLNDVLIKIHPRETNEYKKYFPGAKILDKPFPIQLLALYDNDIRLVISVNSSASKFFEGKSDIITMGYDIHPILKLKLG
jgi:hypothetical protein